MRGDRLADRACLPPYQESNGRRVAKLEQERERSKEAKRTHTLTGLKRAPRTHRERKRERERGGCEIGDFLEFQGF